LALLCWVFAGDCQKDFSSAVRTVFYKPESNQSLVVFRITTWYLPVIARKTSVQL
jgi:hypothetical protein